MKLAIVVGTRPEIIRLACIIKKADQYFDLVLIHTGQNWDKNLNDVFFDEMGIRKPDYFLNIVGKDLGESMGNIISRSYSLFQEIKPDCLLILGDTNSALSAISAKRLKIPIFHMEAGNRCFDLNVPEEINRKIVDHISDVNLPYTENSRRYLLNEGFRGDFVYVTGSPIAEIAEEYKEQIDASDVLERFGIEPKKYIVLSTHREENVDLEKNYQNVIESLNRVAEHYQVPVIFSTHPRTRKRLEERGTQLHSLIRIMNPLGYFDYCCLQKSAMCTLSDSGTISEESSIMNFPAVSFRTSTERPEALDNGSIVLGSIIPENVIQSIDMSIGMMSTQAAKCSDYVDTNVSTKVLKLIQSYTPVVNRVVWMK